MAKLFFSYSHRDESLRDELEIHLSMLKRQGIIETWHDRRIGAGKEVKEEIDKNLEESNVILLLISPYFLGSDYCYDIEMKCALEKHERGEARVIPVILHPCDWHEAPFGKLLAAPKDGKAVSKYPNQHDAFLEIVSAIKAAVKDLDQTVGKQIKQSTISIGGEQQPTSKLRSSNLRIKRDFSDREKDEFLEETYKYIANYFEGSLEELQNRNSSIKTKFKRIDINHFTATIYKNDRITSQCKIWLGGRGGFVNGIAYSSNASSYDNSFNESMSVEGDGYMLFLKPIGMALYGQGRGEKELLSQQGAAEYFWGILIQHLQ